MTKIISSAALKGGTGKTMFTFQVASELARRGHKVLLMDADPQCNLSNNIIEAVETAEHTIAEIFERGGNKKSLDLLVLRDVVDGLSGLDLIPSSIYLRSTEEGLKDRAGREGILARWIRDNSQELSAYDYLFIDTNVPLGVINTNIFAVCDSIVLISDVSENSLLGLEGFCALWEEVREDLELEDNVRAIVFNNVNIQLNAWGNAYSKVFSNDAFGPLLVDPPIPSRAIMKESEAKRVPLCLLKPGHPAAVAIRGVVDGLFEKGVF